jgi:hypothetical protein
MGEEELREGEASGGRELSTVGASLISFFQLSTLNPQLSLTTNRPGK